MLLLVGILSFVRISIDRISYDKNENKRDRISRVINTAKQTDKKLKEQQAKGAVSQALIQKEFYLFKDRDVIPKLQEIILSTLPNEKNTSDARQIELYHGFSENDVEKVTEVPRKKRKQLFVTSMSIYYTNDVETAEFGQLALKSGGGRGRGGRGSDPRLGGASVDPRLGGSGRGRGRGGAPAVNTTKYTRKKYSKKDKPTDEEEVQKQIEVSGPGFIVSMAGYSPYEKISELMDPVGVENDKGNWGIITRLMHLDELVDGNCPFKLFRKSEIQHCNLEIGEVDLDSQMPTGIGIEGVRKIKSNVKTKVKTGRSGRNATAEEVVLIDPMTKEIVSKIAELDEDGMEKTDKQGDIIYEINDHWFKLDLKFLWKKASEPKQEEEEEPRKKRRSRRRTRKKRSKK